MFADGSVGRNLMTCRLQRPPRAARGLPVLRQVVLSLLLPLLASAGGTAKEPAALAAKLGTDGVAMTDRFVAQLPTAGLDLASSLDEACLEDVAGASGREALCSARLNAPVRVVIEPVTAGDERIGHRVRTVFCLGGTIVALQGDEAVRRSLGFEREAGTTTATVLGAGDLEAAGIVAAADDRQQFVFIKTTLLQRIVLQGVVRTERRETADGIEIAWEFDHRFDALPERAAAWTRLAETAEGQREPGPPQPYPGGGGIVMVRQLPAKLSAGEDLLVVESRSVIAEPVGWFSGSNLLRSEIPLTAQEGVRRLRQRLEAARQPESR
jgi:hypothetical protein